MIGRLEIDEVPRPDADAQLVLFVLDSRTGRPAQTLFGVGAPGSDVAMGWEGRYQRIAEQYPWLRGLASGQDADGSWTAPGQAIALPLTATPVVFQMVPGPDDLPVTDPADQLTFAVVLLGGRDDGPVYWAQRVTPS